MIQSYTNTRLRAVVPEATGGTDMEIRWSSDSPGTVLLVGFGGTREWVVDTACLETIADTLLELLAAIEKEIYG